MNTDGSVNLSNTNSNTSGTTNGSASSNSNDAFWLVDESTIHRRATVVLEHLIQASDVVHTMQRWDVFLFWNERLFQEQSFAYQVGRADREPYVSWYTSELWFFDHYVIPLAEKLVSLVGEEYLQNAVENRRLWETNGLLFCQEMAVLLPTYRGSLLNGTNGGLIPVAPPLVNATPVLDATGVVTAMPMGPLQ